MNSFLTRQIFLHPEEPGNLEYWAAKWGITVKQLSEAIVDTGKLNISEIKSHLIKKKLVKSNAWINSLMHNFLERKNPKRIN